MNINIYIITSFFTSAVTVFIGLLVYLKRPDKALNRVWGLFCTSVAWWSFFVAMMFGAKTPVSGLLYARLSNMGAYFIPATCMHFTFTLLDMHKQKKRLVAFGYLASSVLFVFGFSPALISGVSIKPPLLY